MNFSTLATWFDALQAVNCSPVWTNQEQTKISSLCPAHSDCNKSLTVSVGSVVPVVAHCFAGCSFKEITDALGTGKAVVRREPKPWISPRGEVLARETKRYTNFFHDLPSGKVMFHGEACLVESSYSYYDAGGDLVGAVLRCRKSDGSKTFRMASYVPHLSDHPTRPWAWGSIQGLRPLFGLSGLLNSDPDREVWVVEGEKACLYMMALEPDYVWLSWMGGANAWNKTDWTPLRDRDVLLWADADDAGRKAVGSIALELRTYARSVRVVQPKGDSGMGIDDCITKNGAKWVWDYAANHAQVPYMKPAPEPDTMWGFKKIFQRNDFQRLEMLIPALEMEGVQLRFNVRAAKRQIRWAGGQWVDVAGARTIDHLRLRVARNYAWMKNDGKPSPLTYNDSEWRMLLSANDYETEVDTFAEWLNQLPAWDGQERLAGLLGNLFTDHADAGAVTLSHQFAQWAGMFLFCAPVQLTLHPTSQRPEDRVHTRPLFVGAKGIGKSSMLQSMFPEEYPEWFSASFTISKDDRAMVDQIMGRVLVEVGELFGLTGVTRLKWQQFVSRNQDNVRLYYRKNSSVFPRRCILIGTTNAMRPLPYDPAGWRRDLPILLGDPPRAVETYLIDHRAQLWAEALYRVRKGHRVGLPQHMKPYAARWTLNFMEKNDVVYEAVSRLPAQFPPKRTTELLVLSGLAKDEVEAVSLSREMLSEFKSTLRSMGCLYVKWQLPDSDKFVYGWSRAKKGASL